MQIIPKVVRKYEGANEDKPTVTLYEITSTLWFVGVDDGRNGYTEHVFFTELSEAKDYYRGWVPYDQLRST